VIVGWRKGKLDIMFLCEGCEKVRFEGGVAIKYDFTGSTVTKKDVFLELFNGAMGVSFDKGAAST